MSDSNSFSVSSGEVENNPDSYVAALRNTARCISEDFSDKKIHVYGLYMAESFHGDLPVKDHIVMAHVNYWDISDEEEKEFNRDRKIWSDEDKIIKQDLHIRPISEDSIGMSEFWAEPGFPADVAGLLNKVADHIESFSQSIEIIDLVYHDHTDADGSQRPSIRFYYVSKDSAENR